MQFCMGGGNLEFETGVWTPSSAVAAPTIPFSKQHDKPPTAVWLMRTDIPGYSAGTNEGWEYFYWKDITSARIGASTALFGQVTIFKIHPSSSQYFLSDTVELTHTINETGDGTGTYPRTYVSETGFCPNLTVDGNNGKWLASSYKWVAIWI